MRREPVSSSIFLRQRLTVAASILGACRDPGNERAESLRERLIGIELLEGWNEGACRRVSERIEAGQLSFLAFAQRHQQAFRFRQRKPEHEGIKGETETSRGRIGSPVQRIAR